MDLSTLPLVGPLIGAALHLGADLLATLTSTLDPVAGPLSAAVSVVLVTLAVRAALIPLSVLQVRAERDRRRIAPQLTALRKRHAEDPERLRRAVQELYTAERVAPLAGCLPVLAQAPVVSLVYALFTHATIAGATNTLLEATLVGIPLGHSFVAVVTSPLWAHAWVVVVLLAVLAVVVELSRRANTRWNSVAPVDTAVPGAAATAAVTRWVPFVTVVFTAIAPLAAALYVVTSSAWTAAERAVLRRVLV